MLGLFGWDSVDEASLKEIRNKLTELEALSLNEILGRDKHWNHELKVSILSKDAQKDLEAMGQAGMVEKMLSLRITGPKRVWGKLESNVVSLVWWDPNHLVYPVEKD